MGRTSALYSALLAIVVVVLMPSPASAGTRSGALTWRHPQLVDPPHGFTSVSCVASNLCRAGDAGNRVERWNGTHWQHGRAFPSETAGIVAMTCTTADFCAAVQLLQRPGGYRKYRPITRRANDTWDLSAPIVGTKTDYRGGISCVGTRFCMLVDGHNRSQRWNGTSWTAPQLVGPDRGATAFVSCPTTTRCRMVDRHAYRTWNGTAWSAGVPLAHASSARALECPKTSFCMLVTRDGYQTLHGSTWSDSKRLGNLTTLSCTGADFCLTLDYTGHSFRWNGSRWDGPHSIASAPESDLRVSCASPRFCAAVSAEGDAIHRVGGHWQSPRQADPPFGRTSGVSCGSRSLCVLVDRTGAAAIRTGSTWSAPKRTSPGSFVGFSDVSCVGTSFCLAVTQDGAVQTRRDGKWSPRKVVFHHAAAQVSCGSSTLCAATTSDGAVFATGSSWQKIEFGGSELVSNIVSCARHGCLISHVDQDPSRSYTRVYRPGAPSPATGENPGIIALSCVSLSFCMGVTADNRAMRWHAATSSWTPAPMAGGNGIPKYALSCASTKLCVSVGSRSASTWDGTRWSAPEVIIGAVSGSHGLRGVSCRPKICAAADQGAGRVVLAT